MSGTTEEVIWHEVEIGGYGADIPIWCELAASAGGPVLELGAGSGRIAIQLAARGVEIAALDTSAALLEELARRADRARVEVETIRADARALSLGRRFAAILAPMQFVHLLGGESGRARMLSGVVAQLSRGGTFAAALLGPDAGASMSAPGRVLPDVREIDGRVYSSLPLEVVDAGGALEVRRLRQVVTRSGELTEETETVRLDRLTPERFEREALAAGLERPERVEVPPTPDHVGSTVCVLEAG